jgi:biopolymer transport protein ExbB
MVMWPILAVSTGVWVIGIDKMFRMAALRSARKNFLNSLSGRPLSIPTGYLPYDKLLASLANTKNEQVSPLYRFREFMCSAMPEIDSGFSTMSVLISAAPLLGLLGTVSGMMKTFEVIQIFGIGNPHMMSEGISIALITTQAGLTAAFPGMLLHNYLLNRRNRIVNDIKADGDRIAGLLSLADRKK